MMPSASSKRILFPALFCALLLSLSLAQAQLDNLNIGVNENRPNNVPVSDSSSGYGIPYSAVLRDVTFSSVQPVQPIRGVLSDESNIGSGGGLRINTGINEFNHAALPITVGGPPSNAKLKLGRFYLKVDSVSGTILASDNINQSENHREFGAIGIVRFGVVGQFQITDDIQFSTRARLFYLPFINRFGVAGFGMADPLADLFFSPLGGAQLAYTAELSHWDIQIYDMFKMSAFHAGADLSLPVAYGFSSPREEDRAGRYVFADGSDIPPSGRSHSVYGSTETSFLSLENQLGFTAGRMVPTETYVQFGASHSDYWYDGEHGLVPHSHDVIFASAQNERDNLRFKPGAYYSATHSDFRPGWSHRIAGHIHGPITENMTIHGGAGYFWRDNSTGTSMIYNGGIEHTIGPYTSHGFEVTRTVTEPVEEIVEDYQYRINKILGPDLIGFAFASYSKFTSLEKGVPSSSQQRVGGVVSYAVSPRSHLEFRVNYTHVQSENVANDELTVWRGQIIFYHRPFQTIHFQVSYRYQMVETSRRGGNYDENLLVLTVTKTF